MVTSKLKKDGDFRVLRDFRKTRKSSLKVGEVKGLRALKKNSILIVSYFVLSFQSGIISVTLKLLKPSTK